MVYITYTSGYILTSLVKIPLSMLFSFIIGYERELHSHPGGVMTHMLVGLGSCLFTMCSVHISDNYPSVNSDPARICAQIVSGMGFLGSATIYKSKNYIKGINTAANLWISAAISMAIGADLWEFAFITSLGTIIVLFANNRYKIIKYVKNKELRKQMRRKKRGKTPVSKLKEIKVIHPCEHHECPICMPYCSEDDEEKKTEIESSELDDTDNNDNNDNNDNKDDNKDDIEDGYIGDGYIEEDEEDTDCEITNDINIKMRKTNIHSIKLKRRSSFKIDDNIENIVYDINETKNNKRINTVRHRSYTQV